MEGYTVKGIKKPSGQGFVLAIVLAPSFTVVSGRAEMGVVDPWSIYRWSQGMDIIIPSGTDLAIDIFQEDLCNIENTQGFKVFCGFLSCSHSWMKDLPWMNQTEECSICYVSLLEGTHNFWKLQENYNPDSTLQGILMYWPMHVLRQQQFLPLLGHLHSHLMVKLWCNWGSHGFHTDWFLLGVT